MERERERERERETAPPTHTSKGHQVLSHSTKKQVCTINHHDSPPICEYAMRDSKKERESKRERKRQRGERESVFVFCVCVCVFLFFLFITKIH